LTTRELVVTQIAFVYRLKHLATVSVAAFIARLLRYRKDKLNSFDHPSVENFAALAQKQDLARLAFDLIHPFLRLFRSNRPRGYSHHLKQFP
jgi:hypothetical protein